MLGLWKRLVISSGYIAHYGYTDGSGDYYITIDSKKCNACAACMEACPGKVFEIITDDYEDKVAQVRNAVSKNLKYLCAACKPVENRKPLPCIVACKPGAISHSW